MRRVVNVLLVAAVVGIVYLASRAALNFSRALLVPLTGAAAALDSVQAPGARAAP